MREKKFQQKRMSMRSPRVELGQEDSVGARGGRESGGNKHSRTSNDLDNRRAYVRAASMESGC